MDLCGLLAECVRGASQRVWARVATFNLLEGLMGFTRV